MALGLSSVGGRAAPTFDAARTVLETRCLECHTQNKPEGGLIMNTRETLFRGGDSGSPIESGNPGASELVARCKLPAEDSERMPPKKEGEPLAAAEIEALARWIEDGAPWPEGETLSARAATALPRWDAPADPRIVAIEAYPASVSLETAADFHEPVVIVRMKDESTHDVTHLSKWIVENPAIAKLEGTRL
ncbi:MAG: hypothetical protein KDN05_04235, partial [Verrucomicrobiae bacterium]|nr:hypothetical protein [Verrucomicrobiae bacterium]